jgi:hypothetical protein
VRKDPSKMSRDDSGMVKPDEFDPDPNALQMEAAGYQSPAKGSMYLPDTTYPDAYQADGVEYDHPDDSSPPDYNSSSALEKASED